MHVITGGSYKGVNYGCMYDYNYKYSLMTEDEKYYFHIGICEEEYEKGTDTNSYLLAFDAATDQFVYAEKETDFINQYFKVEDCSLTNSKELEKEKMKLDELFEDVKRRFQSVLALQQ